MNEGFFSSSVVTNPIKHKALPPVLNLPQVESKAKSNKQIELPPSKLTQYIMDIECYTNYFLVKFLNVVTDEIIDFEQCLGNELEIGRIEHLLKKSEIITFNGECYDMLMLRLALTNVSNKTLKQASDAVIKEELRPWEFEKRYELPKFKVNHIDLIELIFGIASLKMYGARLHCKRLQDLPIEPDTILTEQQMDDISDYCCNDVAVTKMAFIEKIQQIELRRAMSKKYKVDLLSKSDAQIAEAVLSSEIEAVLKKEIKKPDVVKKSFKYVAPDFIKFNSPILNDVLDIVTSKAFTTGSNGVIKMPEALDELQVTLGSSTYSLGMGGLHSTEKSIYHVSDEKQSLWDWDVASYYPSIIINCGLYPKHLGKEFLIIYKEIVDERLEAKRTGDKSKADSLKITINGSFGKLGQPYSKLYAPELMVQVTVTGQLSLLMLIEMLEAKDIPVISGNTDGIVMKCPRTHEQTMYNIIKRWEKITGFEMESTQYLGLFSRDINNYIAIKPDGESKTKGTFAVSNIAKNPENDICTDAMVAYIKYGTPFMQTIRSCRDITKFLTVRRVNGGAIKDGEVIGKVIRFYHSSETKGVIEYKTTGNKVPNSENCKPLMNLPDEFPRDIDYLYYENKCKTMF